MQFTSGAFNTKVLRELDKEYQYGREVGEAFLRVLVLVGKLLVNPNGGLRALDRKSAYALIDTLEDRHPGMNNDEYDFMASSIFELCCCGFQSDENEDEAIDGLPLTEIIDLVLFHELDKSESRGLMLVARDASKVRQ